MSAFVPWTEPHFKVKTIKKLKGRKKRAERKQVKSVRPQCVRRDGHCRVAKDGFDTSCEGKSEWAHLPEFRRSKTMRRAPEERHTTKGSVMACTKHHDHIDGRRQPRLLVDGDADHTLQWNWRD